MHFLLSLVIFTQLVLDKDTLNVVYYTQALDIKDAIYNIRRSVYESRE